MLIIFFSNSNHINLIYVCFSNAASLPTTPKVEKKLSKKVRMAMKLQQFRDRKRKSWAEMSEDDENMILSDHDSADENDKICLSSSDTDNEVRPRSASTLIVMFTIFMRFMNIYQLTTKKSMA